MAGDKARVSIIDQTSGKKWSVILPTNVPASQLRPALVRQLGLTTEGSGGAPQQYHLALEGESGATRLGEDETLSAAGVQEGAVLRITPEMRAGVQEATPLRYFKLRLISLDGTEIFETDFLSDRFEYFIRELASILIDKQLLHEGERYNARIIPRTDGEASFDKPKTLQGKDIADDGQGFLDIMFDGALSPVNPITYLTTQIRSKETDIVFRFDWRPASLVGTLLTSATQALLDDGTLKDGDHFHYTLSAHDKGRPRIDPIAVVKKPVAVAPRSTEVKDLGEITITPADSTDGSTLEPVSAKDDFEIIIESVEELIKPETRSTTTYPDVELVGRLYEGDLPIFIKRSAREQTRQSAHVSAKSVEEVGGFLLGNVYRDADTEQLFVDISEVVEADQAHGTYVSLDFTYNAWRQVLDRIDKDFKGRIPVGWYHTHLISQAVVVPVAETPGEYIARYVPFFSQPDVFIHSNFFPDPWHVGLVLDLRCGYEVFFAWQKGEIKSTGGFYLYGE